MPLHKHRFVRAISAFSLTVFFIFCSGVCAPAVKAESISDLKAQLAGLEEREEQNGVRLKWLREETERLQTQAEKQEKTIEKAPERSLSLFAQYAETLHALEEAEAEAGALCAEKDRLAAERAELDAAVAQWYEDYAAALEAAGRNAAASGFAWPMPGYTYITCGYGNGHRGVDISGRDIYGKPITAAGGGTVTYSGWMGSYGYCVFINHGGGWSTRYAHASALACSAGDVVRPGQVIAYVGSTGNSTGPHLHFEVLHNGDLQDPLRYF